MLKSNIQRFGCVAPILILSDLEIIDGHVVWEACKALGQTVPTLTIDHLNEGEIRALRISLNKMAELSSWDEDVLKEELIFLSDFDPDLLAATAFDLPEIDNFLVLTSEGDENEIPEVPQTPVSQLGDLWLFEGGHRLLCGDALKQDSYSMLMDGETAQVLATDPPYGCRIAGHASRKHEDFQQGCNLSPDELRTFLTGFLDHAIKVLDPGALTYIFMDGRGLHPLFDVIAKHGLDYVDCCVWDKVNPGMGSFYRQQAEFAVVSKVLGNKHINNIELGKHGRNRSNIWPYPGMASFGKARSRDLDVHPTVKPVGIMAELILDATKKNDIVLDPFAGSGTTLVATHRVGRRAYGMELDPKYVDVCIKRMKLIYGIEARHAETGLTFEEMRCKRAAKPASTNVKVT
jgi:DNA modification methylase